MTPMKFLPIALVLALLLPAAASAQWRTTRVYRGPGTPASNMCNTGADLGIVYTNYRNNGATYVCRVLNGQYKWVKVVGDDGTEQVKIVTMVLGYKTIGAGELQLPPAATCEGCLTVVRDAANTSDCVVGTGNAHAVCYSDGSTWGPLGGGGIAGNFTARGTYDPATEYAALDLATGLVQWTLIENYGYDGTGNWQTNGFRRYFPLDHPADPECDTVQWPPQDAQSMWLSFWFYHQIFGTTDWEPKMKLAMHRMMASLGLRTADFGQFHLMSAISSVLHPGQKALHNLPFNLQDNGGGSYTLTWTAPQGAEYYRVKWSPNRIVDWIGFNSLTNSFVEDAATTDNWFAAENAPNIPEPGAPGTPQSVTIETGVTGLSSDNFSVRAWSEGTEAPPVEFVPGWRGDVKGTIR